jgi:hypothetical protein
VENIISPHLFQRWNERIGMIYYENLEKEVNNILDNGHRQYLRKNTYSVSLNHTTLVVQEFENTRLIKTVY